jgi:hypothetical protein
VKAVKATFKNGRLKFAEKPPAVGPVEVLVVFPEADPWDAILNDPTPRPKLAKLVAKCERAIAKGKTQPLDLDRL